MKSNIFINAQELADELGVSKGKAYKLIQSWNERLEQMGYTTVRGRVSRKYYLEQMYGLAERKETGNACL